MWFPRRRWAARIAEGVPLPIGSPTATLLISMLVWAAKENERAARRIGAPKLQPRDGVLIVAATMVGNKSAVAKLSRELGIGVDEAEMLLIRAGQVARNIAYDLRLARIVEIADESRRRAYQFFS